MPEGNILNVIENDHLSVPLPKEGFPTRIFSFATPWSIYAEPFLRMKGIPNALQYTLPGLRSWWGLLIRIAVLIAPVIAQVGCIHRTADFPLAAQPPALEQKQHVAGTYHTVVEGEDIAAIAKAYRVDVKQLAEANNLKAPYTVDIGAKIVIPGVAFGQKQNPTGKDAPEDVRVSAFKGKLGWPVQGTIVSKFGDRGQEHNEGIRIQSQQGTPVRAAADGRVGYILSLPDLGNLVLIEHADRLVTVYAHMKDITVHKGDSVKRGGAIGSVGMSGRVEGPLLYFEVRSRSKPRNPLVFLEPKE